MAGRLMQALLIRWGVVAVVAVAFYAFAWYRGDMHGTQKLIDYRGEQATQAVAVITLQGKATERVVTRYIKVKGDTQVVTQTISEEVIRYVEANSGSCLDARWRVLHDAAATNTVPDTESVADGTAGAPTAAAALDTVTENYAACNRTADRLVALQAWVREQEAVRP